MSTSPDDVSSVTTTFVIPTVYARRVAESLRDLGLVLGPMPDPPDDPRLGPVHIAIPDHEVVSLLAALSERYTVTRDDDTFGTRVTVEDVTVVRDPAAPWLPRLDLMDERFADLTWPPVADPDALADSLGAKVDYRDVCLRCEHDQSEHVAAPYESPDGTQQRLVVICTVAAPDDPPCSCLTRLDPSQVSLPGS